MQKQPVMEEVTKLQHYIKRFCPELPNVKFSMTRYRNLSEEEQEQLIIAYIHNIRQLSVEDDLTN